MSNQNITPEEIELFFLIAYLNIGEEYLKSKEPNRLISAVPIYIEFRYDYWKDDERVEFVNVKTYSSTWHKKGLCTEHPLSVYGFDEWLKNNFEEKFIGRS